MAKVLLIEDEADLREVVADDRVEHDAERGFRSSLDTARGEPEQERRDQQPDSPASQRAHA